MSLNFPPELPISPQDWARTPPAVQKLVIELWEQVQTLQAKVAILEEQLGQHSQDSSQPPSTDPPEAPKRQRKPSGRSRGGQPGHQGAGRSLKPIEEVDEVIEVKPERCACCGAELEGSDPHLVRHQVTELPPIKPRVTEYQLHRLECPACGTSTPAQLPEGVPRGAFGPRIQALVSLFTGTYRISKRNVQNLLSDCFGADMALGSVSQLEQATSEAIAEPVEEAKAYVQEQQAANVDETGWRQENKKAWLWTAVRGRCARQRCKREKLKNEARPSLECDFDCKWLCVGQLRIDFSGQERQALCQSESMLSPVKPVRPPVHTGRPFPFAAAQRRVG